MVRLYRTFSNLIFTVGTRYVGYLYTVSEWFNPLEPPRTFSNHVRQELISPLLRRVAHCMSSVVAPDGWNGGSVYSSALNVETNTESRPHIPGAKPRVDYMLVGHDGSDVLYRVPVEVKKVITKNDMSQLANYMGCLGGTGDFSGTNIGVGFLMDESVFRIAFSPLSCDGLVLPVVFFSPAIKWREETTLNRGACVALCLLQKLAVKRLEVTSAALSECLGQAQWLAVKEAAETQDPPPPTDPGVLQDFFTVVEDLKHEIEGLKAELVASRAAGDTPKPTPGSKRTRLQL